MLVKILLEKIVDLVAWVSPPRVAARPGPSDSGSPTSLKESLLSALLNFQRPASCPYCMSCSSIFALHSHLESSPCLHPLPHSAHPSAAHSAPLVHTLCMALLALPHTPGASVLTSLLAQPLATSRPTHASLRNVQLPRPRASSRPSWRLNPHARSRSARPQPKHSPLNPSGLSSISSACLCTHHFYGERYGHS